MPLPDVIPTRKQRFDGAIRTAGLTQADWTDLHDISPEHLRLVLTGVRDGSAALNAAIDATIDKYLRGTEA